MPPILVCPLDRCVHHDGNDCTKSAIVAIPRSDDWDVTLACPHQDFDSEEKAESD